MQPAPVQATMVVQGLPPPQPVVVKSTLINRQAVGLGSVQLILGVFCIILNIAGICLRSAPAFGGTGIWAGIMFIITASFGIVAGLRKFKGWYITYMILSIISACLTVFLVMQSGIGLAYEDTIHSIRCHDPDYKSCSLPDPQISGKRVVHGLLLFIGLAQAVFFIWAAAICCRVVCCQTAEMENVPGQTAVYQAGTQPIAQPGQQVMMVHQAQPGVMYRTIPATTQQQFMVVSSQPQVPPAHPQSSYPTQEMQGQPRSEEPKQAL